MAENASRRTCLVSGGEWIKKRNHCVSTEWLARPDIMVRGVMEVCGGKRRLRFEEMARIPADTVYAPSAVSTKVPWNKIQA